MTCYAISMEEVALALMVQIRALAAKSGLLPVEQAVAMGSAFFCLSLDGGSSRADIIEFLDAYIVRYQKAKKSATVN